MLTQYTVDAFTDQAFRGGELLCRMEGNAVCLVGQAALYARPELYL